MLRPGGVLIGSDSLPSNELHHFHADDTYNPVEPASMLCRLQTLGFANVTVIVDYLLKFIATKPAPQPETRLVADGRSRGTSMTDIRQLRAAITGLIGLAATEEQALLASAAPEAEAGIPPGGPRSRLSRTTPNSSGSKSSG